MTDTTENITFATPLAGGNDLKKIYCNIISDFFYPLGNKLISKNLFWVKEKQSRFFPVGTEEVLRFIEKQLGQQMGRIPVGGQA